MGSVTSMRVNNLVKWEQAVANGVGELVIYTNIPSLSNSMTKVHIHGYNYSGLTEDIDLKIGFYAYNSSGVAAYVNYAVTNNGTFPVSAVRLMRHTVNNTVVIVITSGMPSAFWQYPKIFVDAIFGHSNITTAATQGWTASLQTDLTAYTPMVSCGISNTINSTQDQTIGGLKTFTAASTFNSTINANAPGSNIRTRANGTTSLDGFVGTNSDGTLYFSNWDATRGIRVNVGGSVDILGGQALNVGSVNSVGFNDRLMTGSLAAAAGSYITMSTDRIFGSTNNFQAIRMIHRTAATPTDWTTAELIDGIGVDTSFLTPTTIRNYIKRNPMTQSTSIGSGNVDQLIVAPAAVMVQTGMLQLTNATSNTITFATNGTSAPTFTTRSVGTKIVLYNQPITASTSDYAFGIDSSTLWSSVPASTASFKWYAGVTNIMTLSGAGALTVNNMYSNGASASGRMVLTANNTSNAAFGGGDPLEIRNDTGFPAITFHKAGVFAPQLRVTSPTTFQVVDQAGSTLVDLQTRAVTSYSTTNSLNTQRIIFTVAGQARPTGTAYVEWVGPVQPTNAADGDTWVSTV
jgi:hypothetical protein